MYLTANANIPLLLKAIFILSAIKWMIARWPGWMSSQPENDLWRVMGTCHILAFNLDIPSHTVGYGWRFLTMSIVWAYKMFENVAAHQGALSLNPCSKIYVSCGSCLGHITTKPWFNDIITFNECQFALLTLLTKLNKFSSKIHWLSMIFNSV